MDRIQTAVAALQQGHLEDAAAGFLLAFEEMPDDWTLPNEAGTCLYRLERYEEAIATYEKALEVLAADAVDERVSVLFNVALSWSLAERPDLAMATLGELFDLDPSYPKAHFEVGKLHQAAGRWEDAIAHFDTAVAQDTLQAGAGAFRPMNGWLHCMVALNKARIYIGHLGQLDDGLSLVQLMVDRFEAQDWVLKLAHELTAQDKRNEARAVVDVLLAADPDNPDANEALATQ